jgi:peptide/nickel transport system permease protein
MLKYIIKRVLVMIPIFIGLTFAIYLLLSLMPGENAAEAEVTKTTLAGTLVTDEMRDDIFHKYGLDVSVPRQYVNWLGSIFGGTWGMTYSNLSKSVISVIGERIAPTLILMGTGLALGFLIAVPLGILSALKVRGVVDNICTVITFLGHSLPGFMVSILGIYLFSVKLGVLPSQFSTSGKYPFILYLLMPACIIAITCMGNFIKQTRSSMLEVMNEEYVKTARSKGLPYRKVVVRHMLRNAATPIVTVIGLSVPNLIGGSVVIERIFSWPGLGSYLVDAINMRDIPVIMGIVALIVIIVLITNLILDIIYTWLDPRLRA